MGRRDRSRRRTIEDEGECMKKAKRDAKDDAPHAITFCGLYTCVALIVPPATIANGATMNATLKKSIAERTGLTPLTA